MVILKQLHHVMHHHPCISLLNAEEFLLNLKPCLLYTKPTKAKEYLPPEIPFSQLAVSDIFRNNHL